MKPEMNQTIILVSVETNEYGDVVSDDPTTNLVLTGKFRYITDIKSNRSNMEEVDSEAMAWFNPFRSGGVTPTVVKGNVIFADDTYFRIEKIIKARDFSSGPIHFLKCFLSKFNVVS